MPNRGRISPRDLRTYGRSRAPRLPDCDYAGEETVHLTICAAGGRAFGLPRVAAAVADSVEYYARRFGYRLYGYTLMPDHVHVLLSPDASGVPIPKWLQAFKSYGGHQYVRLGYPAPLWQRSARDRVCRRNETAQHVLVYIVNNPVRAGLVERWQDWPWTKVFIEL